MRSSIKPACLAMLVWLALPSHGSAAEPFYENLLQKGIRANAEGDSAQAVQDLTLACFGMLEEPKSLMACRVHLALAHAAGGDREAFVETAGRIIELETRFEVYAEAHLDKAQRQAFEKQLIAEMPFVSLSSVEAFSGAVRVQREQELLTMDLDQRRAALKEMLAADPTDLAWQIRMAEVELADGKPAEALARVDAVLKQDTELLVAICLRGEARALLGRCEEALVDLVSCDAPEIKRPQIPRRRLKCHMELEQWDMARTLYDALPAAERRGRNGRTLDKAIRAGEKEAAKRRAAAASAQPATPTPPASEDGAEVPPPSV